MNHRESVDRAGNVEVLRRLASLEKRAELMFRVSAEDARDASSRALLNALAIQYGLFARDLALLARRVGGPGPERAPIEADALRDALEERDPATLMETCESAERASIDAYRAARRCAWPDFVDAMLERHVRVHAAARFGFLARSHGFAATADDYG